MLGATSMQKILLLHLNQADAESYQRLIGDDYYLIAVSSTKRIRTSEAPSLILIDSGSCSLREIEYLSNHFPATPIAFINTICIDEILPYLCIQNVNGMFHKNEAADIVIRGIAALLNQELWFPRKILPAVIKFIKLDATHTVRQIQSLSNKEREVLNLITCGSSNNQIANELNISFHTVKTHIYNLYKKLEVKNRAEAVKLANSIMIRV